MGKTGVSPIDIAQVTLNINIGARCIHKFSLAWLPKFAFFFIQIIYDLEEKLAQIHLPDWQFYLPRAVRQRDKSNPEYGSGHEGGAVLLLTWLCYHLIAKPGNKTGAPPWTDPNAFAAHISGWYVMPFIWCHYVCTTVYLFLCVHLLISVMICSSFLCGNIFIFSSHLLYALLWHPSAFLWPLLLTWFNFNPSMDG